MSALVEAAFYTGVVALLTLGAGVAIISIRHDLMNPRVREEMGALFSPLRQVQAALIAVVAVLFAGKLA